MDFISSGIGVLIVFLIVFFLILISRYKRCPSNKILVVYGKVAGSKSAKCIHGGGAFILPIIQDYAFLNLSPIPIDIDLKGALSQQNIRINTPSTFTVGVSTEQGIMLNAAERLLGLNEEEVKAQALDIIIGQLRLVIATLSIEEINKDREQFLQLINKHVASELNKIGLELINVNIKDITDESGYIEAIGKKAAAEAVNKAKVEVAEQEASGAMGEAKASREKDVQVASEMAQSEQGVKDAEATRRVAVASLESQASMGEAKARREQDVQIANENALAEEGRKKAETQKRISIAEYEAEAKQGEFKSRAVEAAAQAELAKKVAAAKETSQVAEAVAQQKIMVAERLAEKARLEKEQIVQNEIEKEKHIIDAEARAEELRRIARGEADSVLARYEAESKGMEDLLSAKAAGYKEIIEACGGDGKAAATLLLLEQLDTLVSRQTEALANLKIEKITVWDSGGNGTEQSATSNFLRNYIGALPPIHELAKQAGLDLPEFLGSMAGDKVISATEVEDKPAPAKKPADKPKSTPATKKPPGKV